MFQNICFPEFHFQITRKLVTLRSQKKELQLEPVVHIYPHDQKIASVAFHGITDEDVSRAGLQSVHLFEDSDLSLCKEVFMEAFFS